MTGAKAARSIPAILICLCWMLASRNAFGQIVPVNGVVVNESNTPLCSLVLVNGRNQFTCDGSGTFDLSAPLDSDGNLQIQVFVSGFAPYRRTLPPGAAIGQVVEMRRAVNGRQMVVASTFSDAGAGRAVVSGTVNEAGGSPLCAFVLANGQQMFSCGENLGRFELNVPLDSEGQVELQIFAAGFQPYNFVSGVGDDEPPPPPEPAGCSTEFSENDVYVVDLSQDVVGGASCNQDTDREATAACIERRIRAEFADAPGCLSAFDIFVPGTNQEDGNFQQFTKIVKGDSGRTYLSVQYSEESTTLDDGINYDKGVFDSQNALDDLLYTLKVNFDTTDVRVFGHSKGSESVARVSTFPEHDAIQFFAFAQAGRTPDSIRGRPGYIEKLDDNLVGITWENDEVTYYLGGSDGFQTPEVWGFPGFVNQGSGGLSVFPLRIDHHNNYGGDYRNDGFPYCATGNKAALFGSECNSRSVRYVPYFWGYESCTNKAFEMMEEGFVGERHSIGYSGPRTGDCKEVTSVNAQYELVFLVNLGDQDDCENELDLRVKDLTGATSTTLIRDTTTRDTSWLKKTGSIRLPLHMELEIEAEMEDVSGFITSCASIAQSESYIASFVVSFRHPYTGANITRTLIGNSEGLEYLFPLELADKNNVAWRKDSGGWDLHYGFPVLNPSREGLMVKGRTGGGESGTFYKRVHLID